MIRFIYLIILYGILGCKSLPSYLLLEGERVPLSNDYFEGERERYHDSLLSKIDTNVFYEEYDAFHDVLRRNSPTSRGNYHVLRFYPNGCISSFGIYNEDSLKVNMFNPKITGYRGRLYLGKKGLLESIFFMPISELGSYGEKIKNVKVYGDFIQLTERNERYPSVYKKRKVPKSFLEFKAEW